MKSSINILIKILLIDGCDRNIDIIMNEVECIYKLLTFNIKCNFSYRREKTARNLEQQQFFFPFPLPFSCQKQQKTCHFLRS
jgi:hypothetical protein